MIFDLSKTRIFLRLGYTDMRKAVNGLTAAFLHEICISFIKGFTDKHGYIIVHHYASSRNG